MGYNGLTFTSTLLLTDASDPIVLYGKPDDPYSLVFESSAS